MCMHRDFRISIRQWVHRHEVRRTLVTMTTSTTAGEALYAAVHDWRPDEGGEPMTWSPSSTELATLARRPASPTSAP